jgi:hypothetical protein
MIVAGLPILIATQPVDFRCGHQALALMVQTELKLDPHSGDRPHGPGRLAGQDGRCDRAGGRPHGHGPETGHLTTVCRRDHSSGVGSRARQDENWLSLGYSARRPRLDRICAAGVVFHYRTGRKGEYAAEILDGFNGTIQVDAYCGYSHLPRQNARAAIR